MNKDPVFKFSAFVWAIAISMEPLFFACATPKVFKPSVAHTEVGGLRESLVLCYEYGVEKFFETEKIKDPLVLAPYLDCLQKAQQAHAPSAQPGYALFDQELRSYFDSLLEGSQFTTEKALESELAIRAALKGLWQEGLAIAPQWSNEEKRALKKYFPQTASQLKWGQTVAYRSGLPPIDLEWERLKAGFSDLASTQGQVVEYSVCRRYRLLKASLFQLDRERKESDNDVMRIKVLQSEVQALRELEIPGFQCEK